MGGVGLFLKDAWRLARPYFAESEERWSARGLLAAGIVELLRDPAKRRRLGDAARRLIEEEYSAARMAKEYLRVYEEAIASSPGGAK